MVEIRSIRQSNFLHGKAYHIENGNASSAILGSSNFTVPGLGFGKNNNIELNLVVDSKDDCNDLKNWFKEVWDDYSLIVIDESHNFRNNAVGKPKEDGTPRRTRYERLLEDVIHSGQKTKVLLLSATPVNN